MTENVFGTIGSYYRRILESFSKSPANVKYNEIDPEARPSCSRSRAVIGVFFIIIILQASGLWMGSPWIQRSLPLAHLFSSSSNRNVLDLNINLFATTSLERISTDGIARAEEITTIEITEETATVESTLTTESEGPETMKIPDSTTQESSTLARSLFVTGVSKQNSSGTGVSVTGRGTTPNRSTVLQIPRKPCGSVLFNGTAASGETVCPYNNLTSALRSQANATRNLNIAFMGDSRTRFIYHKLMSVLLDNSTFSMACGPNLMCVRGDHIDYHHSIPSQGVNMSMYWHEYPNEAVISRINNWISGNQSAPDYIMLGLGAWTSWFDSARPDAVCNFTGQIEKIAAMINRTSLPNTTFIWLDILPMHEKSLIFAGTPFQAAILDKIAYLTGHTIMPYYVWRSAKTEALSHMHNYIDRWHFVEPLLDKVACLFLAAVNDRHC